MSRPHFITKLSSPLPDLFTFTILQSFPELFHGITTRHSEERQPYDVGVEQVHGTKFVWAQTQTKRAQRTQADAILIDQPNVTVRIGTSDCVPIVVYDATCRRGGVVHAGFKGTTQEILVSVLKQFHPLHTYVGIGPAIGPECYDRIDIQLENIFQAQAVGIPLHHIEVMRWCTKCHHDVFFSHRAGDNQNFGTYIRLAKS